ncbi:MAG: SprT family zinc-dependent metalloprotease [Pseudoxanthomonas sp.]
MPRLFRRPIAPPPRTIERDSVSLALDNGDLVEIARVRDPRAKRIKLSIDERGARLTLPPRASGVAGERFLHQHRDWLAAQLARHAGHADLPTLARGETAALPLRGESVPLHWREGRFTRLESDGDALHFHVPARAGDAALRRALRDFYESQARADVGRWLPRYLPSLPRAPRQIRFKALSSLWGSLAPDGTVSLDLSLVLGQPAAFEYVLVHELCHLLRADHSPAFWREVELRFPAWREQRDYFHAEGRRLKAGLRALLASPRG